MGVPLPQGYLKQPFCYSYVYRVDHIANVWKNIFILVFIFKHICFQVDCESKMSDDAKQFPNGSAGLSSYIWIMWVPFYA